MIAETRDVYLLYHTNPDSDGDSKLIGVYSTEENAKNASIALKDQPGFRDHPECFEICPYRLDITAWEEGFVTV